jgi:hypothetical protein
MQRPPRCHSLDRRALLGALAVGAGLALCAPCTKAHAAPMVDVQWLEPDGAALMLSRFHRATGPLDRYGARPGAWWQLLYAPLQPGWPVELTLRLQRRGHRLQVLALDAAPADAPGVAVGLPLVADSPSAPGRWSCLFVQNDANAAGGVFLYLELWRADAAAPPPLAVRLRSAAWTMPDAPGPEARRSGRVEPPAGPLAQAQRERAAFELPPMPARRTPGVAPMPAWPLETPR